MKHLFTFFFILLLLPTAFAQCPSGTVALTTQSQVDGLSSCSAINGDLYIINSTITSLASLSNITSVSGQLVIDNNSLLPSLSGLNSLTGISKDFLINNNSKLTDLTGLSSLSVVGKDLTIKANTLLASTNGLSQLTSAGGLVIVSNPSFTTVDGLGNLTTVGGNFTIGANDKLTSLTGLSSLSSITGSLNIGDNPSLRSCAIDVICSLIKTPGTTITVARNGPGCADPTQVQAACGRCNVGRQFNNQQELNDFGSYATCPVIEGDVVIGSGVTDLAPLAMITTVTGSLVIQNTSSLTGLTGLNSLTAVGSTSDSRFIISGNSALTSLSALSALKTLSIHQLVLANNSQLSSCAIKAICQLVTSNPGSGTIVISGNATGCASQNEVQTACETAMPVRLSSFSVQAEGNVAQLNWATSFETNTERFQVEHSLNAIDWHPLGQLKAQGESQTLRNYSFTQADPANGTNYYRLKIIDFDATYAYSPIRAIRFNWPEKTVIYPNPATDKLYIRADDWNNVRQIMIHDRTGKLISRSGAMPSSVQDVSQLAAGNYVLRVIYANGNVTNYAFVKP